jgi:hypothetical protein
MRRTSAASAAAAAAAAAARFFSFFLPELSFFVMRGPTPFSFGAPPTARSYADMERRGRGAHSAAAGAADVAA